MARKSPRWVRVGIVVAILAALVVTVALIRSPAAQDDPDPGATPAEPAATDSEGAGPTEQGVFPIIIGLGVVIAVGMTLWFGRSSRAGKDEEDEARVRERRRKADERTLTWEAKRAAVSRRRRVRSDEHQETLHAATKKQGKDYLEARREREKAKREKQHKRAGSGSSGSD